METSHSALPGVTVEAKSPNLQGSRIAVTDAEGRFVLTLLPPGKYTVSATLDGFAPRSETVQLALTQAASITIELTPAKTEAVTVTAEAAAVETDSTVVGRNLDAKTFEALPTGRNYSSVVQLASGVGTDNSDSRNTSITVYGATGLENTYNVDGSNTTGVEYGGQGKTLNFEFIQEVEFKAGGYEAEYGGALGGIINVVTKSGGNEFHGDAFGYFNSDALQASSKHQDVVSPQGIPTGFTKEDFGADVGGYILKDTLWFFGAYDRVDNTQKTQSDPGTGRRPPDAARHDQQPLLRKADLASQRLEHGHRDRVRRSDRRRGRRRGPDRAAVHLPRNQRGGRHRLGRCGTRAS